MWLAQGHTGWLGGLCPLKQSEFHLQHQVQVVSMPGTLGTAGVKDAVAGVTSAESHHRVGDGALILCQTKCPSWREWFTGTGGGVPQKEWVELHGAGGWRDQGQSWCWITGCLSQLRRDRPTPFLPIPLSLYSHPKGLLKTSLTQLWQDSHF